MSIPIVQYESYEEYEALLNTLIEEYQSMVEESVQRAYRDGWCRFYRGISATALSHWGHHGLDLFLKLTKGHGKDWCHMMNTMVVYALDTAVRVMVHTRKEMGHPIDWPPIAAILKRETAFAISDDRAIFNNMGEFEDINFERVYLSDWEHNYDEDTSYLGKFPIGCIQEKKLAFAMLTHKRLGTTECGLSGDLMKQILVDAWK